MIHSEDVRIRWFDMDVYGHVNNVVYLRFLEDARVAMFLGMFPQEDIIEAGNVVARSEIEYLASVEYRAEPLQVDVWCSEIGRSSFTLDYVVRDPDGVGDRVFAVATTTHVMVDLASGATQVLSDYQRSRLESYREEPVAMRSRR